MGRERRPKGQFGTRWVSHGGHPREKHAGSSLAQEGEFRGEFRREARAGDSHVGVTSTQESHQDKALSRTERGVGAGLQSDQVGWPREARLGKRLEQGASGEGTVAWAMRWRWRYL